MRSTQLPVHIHKVSLCMFNVHVLFIKDQFGCTLLWQTQANILLVGHAFVWSDPKHSLTFGSIICHVTIIRMVCVSECTDCSCSHTDTHTQARRMIYSFGAGVQQCTSFGQASLASSSLWPHGPTVRVHSAVWLLIIWLTPFAFLFPRFALLCATSAAAAAAVVHISHYCTLALTLKKSFCALRTYRERDTVLDQLAQHTLRFEPRLRL